MHAGFAFLFSFSSAAVTLVLVQQHQAELAVVGIHSPHAHEHYLGEDSTEHLSKITV